MKSSAEMSIIRVCPSATKAAWASAAPVTSRSPRRTVTTPSRTLAFSSAPGMSAALWGIGRGRD